jgi:serine/threonine-protein kinase
MIDCSGRVKLLDFGLAQLATLSADDPETSLGQLLGTLEYMAPEQARPEGLVDQRVDQYGLGAMLFFLLTGRSPRGTGARRSLLDHRPFALTPPSAVVILDFGRLRAKPALGPACRAMSCCVSPVIL